MKEKCFLFNFGRNSSIWRNLIFCLVQENCIRIYLYYFEAFRGILRHFEAFWGILRNFVAFWGILRLEMMNCHCSFCFTIVWYVNDTTTITKAIASPSIWNGFCNQNNRSSCITINWKCLWCNYNNNNDNYSEMLMTQQQ